MTKFSFFLPQMATAFYLLLVSGYFSSSLLNGTVSTSEVIQCRMTWNMHWKWLRWKWSWNITNLFFYTY